MAQNFESCLTEEDEERLRGEFPDGRRVTNSAQRKAAKSIAGKKGPDASGKRNSANQVVEFLVIHRGIHVSCIVQELKDLYSVPFGIELCHWQNQRRKAALMAHPSRRGQLTSVGS